MGAFFWVFSKLETIDSAKGDEDERKSIKMLDNIKDILEL